MSTRDKIIDAAIILFNEKGYNAVCLSDVADKIGMSRGNLAYHFKEKQNILDEVAERLKTDIRNEKNQRKDFPAFANLQVDIKAYYNLQKRYQFVFTESHLKQNEVVLNVMRDWSESTIKNNLDAFYFSIQIGNMKEEPYAGLYYNLAINSWMITYFWLSQKQVRGKEDLEDAEKMVWSTIIPHFTDKGLAAFNKYFGASFLNNLGKSINNYSKKVPVF
jgi:AcrR family transcriptional regulator